MTYFDQKLYDASLRALTNQGVCLEDAQKASQVVASEARVERTPEQQQTVTAVWQAIVNRRKATWGEDELQPAWDELVDNRVGLDDYD